MFTCYVSSLGGMVGGGYGKSDKSCPENQGEGWSGCYVSMFQNFIFRYCHKLDVKHVSKSNYAFLYISWQTVCELLCGCVYVWGGVGWWLLIVFWSLYYPSFCFIPSL